MKIQKFNKKLVLNKNTIVDLTRDKMNEVKGGETIISCQTVLQCCYTEYMGVFSCGSCWESCKGITFCCA